MRIKYTKNYDKTLKKLRRHVEEYKRQEKILYLIRKVNDFTEIVANPTFKIYGFERLKYELNDYYSFNLSRGRGTIRLIVRPNENYLELVHITFDHYKDFDLRKGEQK